MSKVSVPARTVSQVIDGPCIDDSPGMVVLGAVAHGTRKAYRVGCRCLLCRFASAKARAGYRRAKLRYMEVQEAR